MSLFTLGIFLGIVGAIIMMARKSAHLPEWADIVGIMVFTGGLTLAFFARQGQTSWRIPIGIALFFAGIALAKRTSLWEKTLGLSLSSFGALIVLIGAT